MSKFLTSPLADPFPLHLYNLKLKIFRTIIINLQDYHRRLLSYTHLLQTFNKEKRSLTFDKDFYKTMARSKPCLPSLLLQTLQNMEDIQNCLPRRGRSSKKYLEDVVNNLTNTERAPLGEKKNWKRKPALRGLYKVFMSHCLSVNTMYFL